MVISDFVVSDFVFGSVELLNLDFGSNQFRLCTSVCYLYVHQILHPITKLQIRCTNLMELLSMELLSFETNLELELLSFETNLEFD